VSGTQLRLLKVFNTFKSTSSKIYWP